MIAILVISLTVSKGFLQEPIRVATIVATIAPATVQNIAAVPLRIPVVLPGVCRHCEP